MNGETQSANPGATDARAPRLLLLHEDDTVLIAIEAVAEGDALIIDDARAIAPQAVPAGHKLARVPHKEGMKVVKYGAPIGVATAEVARGAHLHVHNMRSDYIPTHERGDGEDA